MTLRSTPNCAHERRPGTVVCLRCLHEERDAKRARRRKTAARVLIRGGSAAVVLAGLVGGTSLLKGAVASADQAPRQDAQIQSTRQSFAVQSGNTAKPAAAREPTGTSRTLPAIPFGRTELTGGLFAERVGDTVIVNFDTPEARTRRSDKFEHVVRETLPIVLGDAGRAAVEKLQAGELVAGGALIASLDAPLHLSVGDGRIIRVLAGAREGRDGPLVVTYRAIIEGPAGPSET